jgi:hypothetical protein
MNPKTWSPLLCAIVVTVSGCLRMPGGMIAAECGELGQSADAQKVEAFLETGARFEEDSLALASEVEGVCTVMAADLGVEVPSAQGEQLQVEATCRAVANEIHTIIDEALPSGATIEMAYTPPVCSFELDAMASCVAECDASFVAENNVTCEGGQLVGACEGTCSGECRADGTTSEVQGYCAGECAGSCDVAMQAPRCEGEAYVEADAHCEAACDARIDARAECTEPSLEMSWSIDVDPAAQARFDALIATLEANYPRLLALTARLENVVASGGELVTAFEGAAGAAGNLGYMATMCFADSTLLAASSLATIEVTMTVSVEVSASATAQAR